MRIWLLLAGVFLLVHGSSVRAQEEDPMAGFLVGKYQMVGRLPNSERTYTGTVKVALKEGGKLEITRTVANMSPISCAGGLQTATSDKIQVLRIRFTDEDVVYEGTFQINSDLDNYGRLSGYVYPVEILHGKKASKADATDRPGLEVWFADSPY